MLARTSRSVALTDAGRRLLDNAGPAVDQALESLKTVTAKPGEVTGRVRLSVPSASVSTRFVIGSAVEHPHDLVLGTYSVHTSAEALRRGGEEIRRIGQRLRANGLRSYALRQY